MKKKASISILLLLTITALISLFTYLGNPSSSSLVEENIEALAQSEQETSPCKPGPGKCFEIKQMPNGEKKILLILSESNKSTL